MKVKKLLIGLIALSALGAGAGVTAAWFSGATTEVNVESLEGGVISQYFDSGDGSANTPFIITRPVHLYNLTELYEKWDGFAEHNYHFQLGKNLAGNGLCFYEYDDNGILQENSYVDTLNMNYYTALKPIGSAEKPFGGTFDGSELIVQNVHISAGHSDIGFFGFVTEDAEIHDFYIDGIDINVNSAVANKHNTHNTNAHVGFLAGHIEKAASFTNTYINNATITGQSCVIKNNYGYFGQCDDAGSIEEFVAHAAAGQEEAWGGSFHSKTYTNLLYNLNHSTTAQTTDTISGEGGFVIKKTASATTNPNTSQVVYRFRDGAYAPLKFTDDTRTQAALGNTGYLVGSNVGTGANASPKISSYKMVNLQNALTNTRSTNMGDTYKAANIAYTDSKLEIMTYQNGWKRIKDSHNASNNSTNSAITSYTKTDLENFGFVKYADSRDALQEVLESSTFVHGIHFDNNAVSTSSLLTVSANIIRINGHKVTTSYQLPKGSVDFNLKEEGYINFFAGTYNSSQVNLNFFSLNQVTRNSSGNITALTPIKKIYHTSSGEGYIYQTGNSKPSGAGDLAFDVETILHGNAPVINMMYYFEIPVNAGEYAMGVAGSTQGAYMIYLDLGANGSQEPSSVLDFGAVEYRTSPDTTEKSILLIEYTQQTTDSINLGIVYVAAENEYQITYTGPAIKIALLDTTYHFKFNGTSYSAFGLHEFGSS